MTGRWSSQVKKMEIKDLQANTMAVDCTGKLVLLAGRRALGIVNLLKSSEAPDIRKIPRQSKWEVSAAQWNPHTSHSNVFVTACNQRADIWRWDDCKGTSTPQGSLKAHTRVISDLDWSPTEVNMLATCSGDAYTFLWDVRDTRKPAVSMQAVVGASQVKWNHVNTQLLATAHDGDIRIWDPRKGTAPVQYIAAHLSKIHGLDWSPISEFHLASSSQDCTVKFWDITNPKAPEGKLAWSSPVWRARYTPLGDGLATIMVPQLRRGENSLLLWQLNDLRQPVHTFMGHQDVVLEFQWRRLEDESKENQLVSWSRDQSLRLWKVETQPDKGEEEIAIEVHADESPVTEFDLESSVTEGGIDIPKIINGVSVERSTPSGRKIKDSSFKDTRLAFTPPNVGSLPKRDDMQSPQQPKSLHHEFALVSFHIPNVTVEVMDYVRRSFTATAVCLSNVVKLTMLFPDGYPNNEPPDFQFDEGTTVNQEVRDKLQKVLQDTSMQYVRHSRSCIEPCLRQLTAQLEASTENQPEQDSLMYMMPKPNPRFLNFFLPGQEEPVPFPRTCGARFCGAGFLVCFTKPMGNSVRRISSTVEITPRTMSSYGGYSQGSRTPQGAAALRSLFTVSARSPPATDGLLGYHRELGFKERKPRSRSKSRAREHISEGKGLDNKKPKTGPVIIYNIACLLPLSQQLAETYVLDEKDVPAMCRKNASAAAAVGRRDLVQVWSLAALATNKVLQPDPDPDKGPPWAVHAFGRKLLNSLLNYYSSVYDVQTLAMLCCAFGTKYDPKNPLPSHKPAKHVDNVPTAEMNYLTLPAGGMFSLGLSNNNSLPRIKRSNSWSNLTNDIREESKDPAQKEREKHEQNKRILDLNRILEYDQYKRAYSDIMYRWKLFNERADILKYMSTPAEAHKGIEFGAECQHCRKEVRGAQCWHCKNFVLQCVVCHMSVKGSSSFCLACGHGGHTAHIMDWFKTHDVCATGCGCVCLKENPMTAFTDS